LGTAASETVETFEGWGADAELDGGAVVEVGEERALARVFLALFFGTGRNDDETCGDAERRDAPHVNWVRLPSVL
jgi:hypothetical protein